MKKAILCLLTLALIPLGVFGQQVRLSTAYNYPTLPGSKQDSILNGLSSIRGCMFAEDVDGDGKSEVVASNYADNGHVNIFEAVGNDSMQLVWTSPTTSTGGGSSTPRYPIFGDLDNDGKQEVIYQLNNVGILIYEWDGVAGSDNYGTSPSQTIGSGFLAGTAGNYEYAEVLDIDGDGENELLVAYNSSPDANDRYYVISATGDWNTNDPGFSSFSVEFQGVRTELAAYGISGGTPYAMIAAQFDGTGNKEILVHNWNQKNVLVMTVPGVNTYVLPDTSTGKQNLQITSPEDDVALFGGMAYDVDGDGREEVYLPSYTGVAGGPRAGELHMISYDVGQPIGQIDASNVTALNHSSVTGTIRVFGYGYGDIDNNGKPDIYSSTSYPYNLFRLEFQGGDKKNLANWQSSLLYAGDPTIYTDIAYRDSAGVLDTVYTVQPAFAGKIYGRNTDFDNDGLEDIILPYQALNDSIAIREFTWNAGLSRYDTVQSFKVVNPKRWGLRVVEQTGLTGVEGKEVTLLFPDDYRLEQNYPNPFNPSTTISFYLPVKNRISLRVYDLLGREVKTLIDNEQYPAGTGRVTWDGRDNRGREVVSGTYFYTLTFGNFTKTNKMMLLK